MKIVIAPDSFKESLTARQVAEAIRDGFQRALPHADCLILPVGDGGEGTVEAIRYSSRYVKKTALINGPFGDEVEITYYRDGKSQTVKIKLTKSTKELSSN